MTSPHGLLADDRSKNASYDRVPYAFSFRTKDNTMDFVLISVHLAAGGSASSKRLGELTAISNWISQKRTESVEQDYLILGDMNLEDCDEVLEMLTQVQSTLNYQCVGTNLRQIKPFEHVFYYLDHDTEIDYWHLWTIDLVEAMQFYWPYEDPYLGDLETHTVNDYAVYYSDHHPIVFP